MPTIPLPTPLDGYVMVEVEKEISPPSLGRSPLCVTYGTVSQISKTTDTKKISVGDTVWFRERKAMPLIKPSTLTVLVKDKDIVAIED